MVGYHPDYQLLKIVPSAQQIEKNCLAHFQVSGLYGIVTAGVRKRPGVEPQPARAAKR